MFLDGTVNTEKYLNILRFHMRSSIPRLSSAEGEYIFQQDNAPCHVSQTCKTWFTINNVPLLPWPANSPDMSPIDTLWREMKKELKKSPARSKQELKEKIKSIWRSFTPDFCSKLVSTMPNRLADCISKQGDATKW